VADADRNGRLPWLQPGDLTDAQRDTYDRIVGSRGRMANRASTVADERGRLHGPFNAMLFSPVVGAALQEVGQALRTRGLLSDRLRETVILEVARFRRCVFEWYSHETFARGAGLTSEDLAAIRTGTGSPTLLPAERLARSLVSTLLTGRDVTDAQLGEAVTELGWDGMCELIILIGYYDLLALSLRVWRTDTPGRTSPWEPADGPPVPPARSGSD
jgi:4-carboxymuconolactone decarboxylase